MKRFRFGLTVSSILLLIACGMQGTTQAPSAISTSVAIDMPTVVAGEPVTIVPSDTPVPATLAPSATADALPLATMTAELSATVVAELPPTPTPEDPGMSGLGLDGATAQALNVPAGWPQLWVVSSYGMSMGDPPQTHFVAIYSYTGSAWQELDRAELTNDSYLDPSSVAQVEVEPNDIWIEAQGGTGAHSGCYDLLRFDGKQLHSEVSACSSSPGNSRLQDVNGDGMLDAVIDTTDYYIFCYACGVRAVNYTVMHWDGQKMVEARLEPLADRSSQLGQLIDQAVAQAQAGLWKDAQATISQTLQLSDNDPVAKWDAGLIELTANARAEQADSGAYPLIDQVLYGNYPVVLDILRTHTPEDLLSAQSTVVSGTVAEGWEQQVTDTITQTADLALSYQPDLAAAYFLRGWAVHLTDPSNPSVIADIEHAAQIAPNEPLFAQTLALLQNPKPV